MYSTAYNKYFIIVHFIFLACFYITEKEEPTASV